MRQLKIINNVIYIDNFMCVYRNYSIIGTQWKYLVNIHILVVITAHLIGLLLSETFLRLLQVDLLHSLFVLSYNCVSFINNVAAIVMSCYHSALFQTFVANIHDISNIYGDEALYQKSIQKLNKRFFKAVLLWFAITLSLFIIYIINDIEYFNNKSVMIQETNDFILQIRYFWEILAFHLNIEILVANMKYLISSISDATDNLNKECEEGLGKNEEVRGITLQLQKWGDTSGHLVVANECLGRAFGLQITLSLWASILYHIQLLYYVVTSAHNKEVVYIARVGIAGFLMVLMAYFLTKLSVLWSGQRVRNEAQRLDAALARLRVRLLSIPGREAEACASATASLARRLRAAPLQLRLLSSLSIQMALLTEIIGVVVNYTIVLLQFNHVV